MKYHDTANIISGCDINKRGVSVSSIKQKISTSLKLVKLSPEETAYYSKFLDETRSSDIKNYEDIFAEKFDATGIDDKNRMTKVKMRVRKIESLNDLLKISKITQKKTLESPFKDAKEEIQYYKKERLKKEKFFLNRSKTEEMDNDPDTLQGISNMLIWMTQCNNATISLHFGISRTLNIGGYTSPGWWIVSLDGDPWFSGIPTDDWDRLYIKNEMNSSISMGCIEIIHSDFYILQKWYKPPYRLGSKAKFNQRLYLFRDISNTKLKTVYNFGGGFLRNQNIASHSIVYYGAEELGKIDGYKYAGHNHAWCSEFASWLLRRAGLDTPQGNIAVGDMENWFRNHGNLSSNVYSVIMSTGTYLNLWNRQHSSIFLEYVDVNPNYSNPNTQIRTIEGNAGGKVALCTRVLSDISSFGYIP
jgi:hypothetical protein